MASSPVNEPPSAPQTLNAPEGFEFEVRLWQRVPATDASGPGWVTVAWCSTREYAELLAEAAMSQAGCQFAEVWGVSVKSPDARVALVRYDYGPPEA
jgi:hypothetical protein